MKKICFLLFIVICGNVFAQTTQTFIPETGKYYFIKSQHRDNDLYRSYLVESNGYLKFEFFYEGIAGKKDSAQWTIEYVTNKGYTIKNKLTGHYFSYQGRRTIANGVRSNSSDLTDACYFAFQTTVNPFTLGDFVKQGYGIIASTDIGFRVYNNTNGDTGTATYQEENDFAWMFLTENEILSYTDSYNKVNNLNSIADIAFEAYNKTFLVTKDNLQYYRESLVTGDNKDYFWCQALDIQMAEDVYLRTKKTEHKTLIDNLLKTFIIQNRGTTAPGDWGWNEFNDDILWAGLAFVRGYQITANPTHLEYAKYAFDLLYNSYNGRDACWDEELGGGIWWRRRSKGSAANVTDNERAKSALSNSPAVMLACYLYELTEKQEYLEKAITIMDWLLANLYDSRDGGVYENITWEGIRRGKGNVYTNGAFLGAATHIHRLTGIAKYYTAAEKAASFVVTNKTTGSILSHTKRDGTWQSEYSRGLGEFIRDNNHTWSRYFNFNKINAEAAWKMRRQDLNITGNNWLSPMAIDNLAGAMECVGSVIMQQISPEVSPELKQKTGYCIKLKSDPQKQIYVDATDSPTLTVSTQEGCFNLIFKSYGYYQLESVAAPGYALATNGTDLTLLQLKDDDDNQYWKLVYDYQGYHKLKSKNAPLMCLSSDGIRCSLKKEQHTDDERWSFAKPEQGSSINNIKKDGISDIFSVEDNGNSITVREKTTELNKIKTVQINDLYGRSVSQRYNYPIPVSEAELDTHHLIQGVYMLVINTDNNQKKVLKFIKK